MSSLQLSNRDWTSNTPYSSQSSPQYLSFQGCTGSNSTEYLGTKTSPSQYCSPSIGQRFASKGLRKMPKSSTLSVTLSHPSTATKDGPRSPKSPIISRSLENRGVVGRDDMSQSKNCSSSSSAKTMSSPGEMQGMSELPKSPTKSPTITSIPYQPSSPKFTTRHSRDQSKSFFSNVKASKSSSRLQPAEGTIRCVAEDTSTADVRTSENRIYSERPRSGSTPELSKAAFGNSETDKLVGESQP